MSKDNKLREEILKQLQEDWKNCFPKYEKLTGQVAACQASLERALNKYILECNPRLKEVNELHFSYATALKIANNMESPFGFKSNLFQKKGKGIYEALIALNKIRNHLVHPSEISHSNLNKLFNPIVDVIFLVGLNDGLEKHLKHTTDYEDLMGSLTKTFAGFAVGYIATYQKLMQQIVELQSLAIHNKELNERMKTILKK